MVEYDLEKVAGLCSHEVVSNSSRDASRPSFSNWSRIASAVTLSFSEPVILIEILESFFAVDRIFSVEISDRMAPSSCSRSEFFPRVMYFDEQSVEGLNAFLDSFSESLDAKTLIWIR